MLIAALVTAILLNFSYLELNLWSYTLLTHSTTELQQQPTMTDKLQNQPILELT